MIGARANVNPATMMPCDGPSNPANRSYHPFWVINLFSVGAYKGSKMAAKQRGSAMGAERDRVAEFGKLEDGLLQAGEWYRGERT